MIQDQTSVFLGAVVQPKTKAPVWVLRKSHTYRTVSILARDSYGYLAPIGEGYLDGGDMGSEYLRAVDITGFPRVHTPEGIKGRYQGMGYGTSLYTGLVMLASAVAEMEIYPGPRLPGKGGRGVCSDPDSRSGDASEWWEAANKRGLTKQEFGESESSTETEDLEDEDLEDYMSSRSRNNVLEAIRDAISGNSDWYPNRISIRGDLTREVETESASITADYYTLSSAERHKLIAVAHTFEGGVHEWAKAPPAGGVYYKDVILALNVSKEDPLFVGKLALCAKHEGATDAEVTAMIMRNRFGMDLLGTAIGKASVEDFRLGGRTSAADRGVMLANPRQRRGPPPREEPPTQVARNPPTPDPSRSEMRELERDGEKLLRLRENLGWDSLEDLP